jgi:adenine-specific DNA-methyltransferase
VARKTNSIPKALAQKTGYTKRKIEHYTHRRTKRVNNPPVGLVTPNTDRDTGRKPYAYDPHLDPALYWAGKAERISFDVPTVSLHVHERVDPRSIIEAVRKKNGENFVQGSLFSQIEENPPLRQAVDFYKHKHNWSNRLIAGDSLLVMNSLLEKEGMAGKVQMVYIDPPYGIRYGSNFQPFVNKRDVKDGADEDLTQEPEMIRAFRDTWELGIHSYLAYLRDRLLLARELLRESGSCFVQISDENIHLVRNLMDEVFGVANHVVTIVLKKKGSQKSSLMDPVNDYLVWYSRSPRAEGKVAFRPLFEKRELDGETLAEFRMVELQDGRESTISAVPDSTGMPRDFRLNPRLLFRDHPGARLFRPWPITNGGERANQQDPIDLGGKTFTPPKGRCWSHTSRSTDGSQPGMERLKIAGRLIAGEHSLDAKRYLDDFPFKTVSNWWDALGGAADPIYVVQTNPEILKRCILMTTDPGDLVFDPTCGSGTTAYVSEQWGRRWITCDTSRVAVTLAKQRLMTAVFNYYRLAHPDEGVDSGFVYQTVPHVTLKSIANNQPPEQEALYDQPLSEKQKVRVAGPFTVEAVPAPAVKALGGVGEGDQAADDSIARSGETQRQGDWRDELLKTGMRGKAGQRIEFSRVEPLPGTRWLHADAETKEDKPQRVVVSFGPNHAPLEQRQVELALGEAETLRPKPKLVVFAAFQFDPEAAKDIEQTNWPGVTLLKAQMNADLLTEDLKKRRASNESFWLIGQPDVDIARITQGEHKGKYQVTVNGFDYYNTVTGTIDSGGADKIAMWMLDPDYDGRSIFPRQVFFPMAGEGDGWAKLAKNLKAEIDENLIEIYRGTTSLPFEAGKHECAAVKIIDARGIESFKVIRLA